MADVITAAQRQALYKAIFQNIPRSFLKEEHPDNKAIMGAIAYACAYTEAVYRQFESGMFLDSANNGDVGTDGNTSLTRWGIWLQMPQEEGESPEAYRLRLMQRLYTPRVTIAAIQAAISAATGIPVTVEEPADQVVRFNEGAWLGKKVPGRRFNYGSINIVTDRETRIPPTMMNFLRAAGITWGHIEAVRDWFLLSLDGEQASTFAHAWDWTTFWPRGYRPGSPPNPNAWPLRPRILFQQGASYAADARGFFSPRTMTLEGDINATIITVAAQNDDEDRFPVLNWDDSLTLWGESVWGD